MNKERQSAQPIQGAGAAATANNQMVNQLETIFSNPNRGSVAELVARPPTDPKVRGSNPCGPKYS